MIKIQNSTKKLGAADIVGEVPNQCPHCSGYGAPVVYKNTHIQALDQTLYQLEIYTCFSCQKQFLIVSEAQQDEDKKYKSKIIKVIPSSKPGELPEVIGTISLRSLILYEAAMNAYDNDFHETAGMSLRSAAEVLIKDFAVKELSAEREEVAKKSFYQAIDSYLPELHSKRIADLIRDYGNGFTHWDNPFKKEDFSRMQNLFSLLTQAVALEHQLRHSESIRPAFRE